MFSACEYSVVGVDSFYRHYVVATELVPRVVRTIGVVGEAPPGFVIVVAGDDVWLVGETVTAGFAGNDPLVEHSKPVVDCSRWRGVPLGETVLVVIRPGARNDRHAGNTSTARV